VLKAMKQSQLVDKDGAQSKALGIDQTFCRHLPIPVKDAFEVFVEIFTHHIGQTYSKNLQISSVDTAHAWRTIKQSRNVERRESEGGLTSDR
jgi:hypothetical protein